MPLTSSCVHFGTKHAPVTFLSRNIVSEGQPVQGAAIAILVVEDGQLVLGADALFDGGFEAEVTTSGEDAVQFLEGDTTKYRALITDINLLGTLDGWQVGHRARELNPYLPIIYMTGAAADQWSANGVPNSILLNKAICACADRGRRRSASEHHRRSVNVRQSLPRGWTCEVS